jgi:hypothetical protein
VPGPGVAALRDDLGPGSAGSDERCRPGAGIIDVDRWRLRRLLVKSGRSPQTPEAQNQNLDRGFKRRLFHLLERFCGGTLEWKGDALENEASRARCLGGADEVPASLTPRSVVRLAAPRGQIGNEVDDDVGPLLLGERISSRES